MGVLYLVSSDINLTYEQITTIYQKRWKVEEFHKSVKYNVSLAKAPTKTVTTQLSHFYASIISFVKLELLRFRTNMNHFALKSRIYLCGLSASMIELEELSTIYLRKQVTI